MKKDFIKILVDDLDEEILKRMPKWFKILRDAYRYEKKF
jgi:hypothetical protein